MTGLSDSFQRPINYLRISVTDRCNLRCVYCMPADGVCLMPRQNILTYEEIYAVTRAAEELGINKIRLTGGEPLAREGLSRLIRMLAQIEGIDDIALTTNGTMLAKYAAELKAAGLRRVNVSLDTLKPEKFLSITRGKCGISTVLEGIKAATAAGLSPIKINMVVIGGVNDDEILDFGKKTIAEGWHVRFIEHMPFGDDKNGGFVSVGEMKHRLEQLGHLEPCRQAIGSGPAKYFRYLQATGTVGFITPVSEHFCFSCNRLRLTADGKLRSCLLSEYEVDVRPALRNGGSSEGLKELIKQAVANKPLQHHLAEGRVPNDRYFSQIGG